MLGRAWRALGMATILGGSMVMASCHSAVTEGRSSVYLIMDSLEGGSGSRAARVPNSSTRCSRTSTTKGGVVEDPGLVRLRIAFKDVTNPNAPTTNNFVTINRYRVEYRRADGRNRQGRTCRTRSTARRRSRSTDQGRRAASCWCACRRSLNRRSSRSWACVRGGLVISTLADVTFYGRDQTGTEVSVKGTISVNFADWADPELTGGWRH